MRVVVVAIANSARGALTILSGLYRFANENTDDEWVFLLSDRYLSETKNCRVYLYPEIKRSKLKRLRFDLMDAKRIIGSLKADVVLNLQNSYIRGLNVPKIVYQDQSIPFQRTKRFSFFKRDERGLATYQYLIGALIKIETKTADAVIVQTKWMREAVIRQCHVSDKRIYLIPPSVEPEEDERDKDMSKDFDCHCFFYPASASLYKNHKCLYEAAEILKNKNIPFNVAITITENDKLHISNIEYIGTISHSDVMKRLAVSTLVFPSYIETFGLPLIEARSMGSIVLAADTEFSRELLEGYPNAYYFDYDKPSELATLMEKVVKKRIVKKNTKKALNDNHENSWRLLYNLCVNLVDKRTCE